MKSQGQARCSACRGTGRSGNGSGKWQHRDGSCSSCVPTHGRNRLAAAMLHQRLDRAHYQWAQPESSTGQPRALQACLSRPFARTPWSFTCCLLSLGLSLVTDCSKLSSAAQGYRLWRLLPQVFFSTRGRAAKGSPFVQKVRRLCKRCACAVTAVRIGPAQRASRAELCAFCGCRRTRAAAAAVLCVRP